MNETVSKTLVFSLLAVVAAFVCACDWIRAKLDMPTSEDIAKMRELIAKEEAATAASKDTLLLPGSASASGSASGNISSSGFELVPRSRLDKVYYIIVGAFKTDELVALSLKDNAGILEPPFAFSANGLKYVAIGGYDTLEEARKALARSYAKAPNAWVWKKV